MTRKVRTKADAARERKKEDISVVLDSACKIEEEVYRIVESMARMRSDPDFLEVAGKLFENSALLKAWADRMLRECETTTP